MSNKDKLNNAASSALAARLSKLKLIKSIRKNYAQLVEAQQLRMSSDYEGLPLVSILGIVCGLLSGGVIVLFRLLVEGDISTFFDNENISSFEQLSGLARLGLCILGGLVVGLLLHFVKTKSRQLGVVHVIERLDYHQGYLPFKNALVQFITASLCLLSGQSVGREGPSIHIGAAGGSILGRWLRVPNNSLRTLVGCGVAAAIAAAFNTPLAGVIFAMEVVLMEYTIIGFTPIILAAVSATTLTRVIFGDSSAFTVPAFELNSMYELPIVAIMGCFVGALSALFIQSTVFASNLFNDQAIWVRTTLAGCITGIIALIIPQIMGLGYDTVNHVLLAQIGLAGVLILTLAKLLATACAIGFGMPAGLIGPTVYIGACAGSAIGFFAHTLNLDVTNSGFYAILGMAAMMAATLQAPLAALIYLLELTANQAIILPGMIAVICALLTTRIVFKQPSIYRLLMLAKGLDYRNSPISQALRRIGVASVMERSIIQHSELISYTAAEQLLKQEPRWIMIPHTERNHTNLLPATDLARYLNEHGHDSQGGDQNTDINLLNIPAKRHDASRITIIATLQEAHEKMQSEGTDILYITGAHGASSERIYGVITREHVESSYRV